MLVPVVLTRQCFCTVSSHASISFIKDKHVLMDQVRTWLLFLFVLLHFLNGVANIKSPFALGFNACQTEEPSSL